MTEAPQPSEEVFLTPAEVVARWRNQVSPKTLSNWRTKSVRKGPTYVKTGRDVLYPLAGVLEYEQRHKHLVTP